MISKVEQMADEEWRKISHLYDAYSTDDFVVMYELFIEAFTKGWKADEDSKVVS
jgi:hypothetical protein